MTCCSTAHTNVLWEQHSSHQQVTVPSCRSPYVESFHTTAPRIPLPCDQPKGLHSAHVFPTLFKGLRYELCSQEMARQLTAWRLFPTTLLSINSDPPKAAMSLEQAWQKQITEVTTTVPANSYISTFQLQIKRVLLKEGHYHCTEGS